MNLKDHPHRRFNPLTGEWILVSPHRTQRPWSGQIETTLLLDAPVYDPGCYMCPGNTRATGDRNPSYESTYVFENDFPALLPNTPQASLGQNKLLLAESEPGICRVVCFSPRHDLTVARMQQAQLRKVVDVWTDQCRELGVKPFVQYVQIFENRGAMMGASNPHPHGQIWATSHLPNEVAKEQRAQEAYLSTKASCLLCDYLAVERETSDRVIFENEHWVVVVPFWAIWPFETMLLSKRHTPSLAHIGNAERDELADALRRLTTRYDNLFQISFPYSMGFHQQPSDERDHPEWHLHAHFLPPLLRSATVRKFMVGYELLATPQRDITPEFAATRLRELSDVHYASDQKVDHP